MVGRVGDDDFGQTLIDTLKQAGVDTLDIIVDQTAATGVATILVDAVGNNQIVVVPGANWHVDKTDVKRLAQRFQPGDLLLLQFEIPLPIVVEAAALAKEKGVTVVLDPAPAQQDLPDRLFSCVDILTPNQTEASQLVGFPVTNPATALEAAQILIKRGISLVIIKLGDQGAVVATQQETFHQLALPVKAIDTVAAGDAFNGGLAVALAEGMTLQAASLLATTVAGYSVTQRGAQTAMPAREIIEAMGQNP
jgi:ribokinase